MPAWAPQAVHAWLGASVAVLRLHDRCACFGAPCRVCIAWRFNRARLLETDDKTAARLDTEAWLMLSMLADLADDAIRFLRVCDNERLPLEESRVRVAPAPTVSMHTTQ